MSYRVVRSLFLGPQSIVEEGLTKETAEEVAEEYNEEADDQAKYIVESEQKEKNEEIPIRGNRRRRILR